MDNSIFITRFLEQNKNTAISYVDVINCVFDKLSIFEDTMMKIDDYYNEYIHIHRLQHDNIFKFFYFLAFHHIYYVSKDFCFR